MLVAVHGHEHIYTFVCSTSASSHFPWEEEGEEEGLFRADAVNEEDPERDRATQV